MHQAELLTMEVLRARTRAITSAFARRTAAAPISDPPPTRSTGRDTARSERPLIAPPNDPTPPALSEPEQILAALHAHTREGFEAALDDLLSAPERELLRVTAALPHQQALALDHVVERLTRRWGELTGWPPFARVVETGTEVRADLRVTVLELLRPSRDLAGRVAFRIERDLRRVRQPIPEPVLRSLAEHREGIFVAYAFGEPLYGRAQGRGERMLLRSVAAVRREHCRPIDPLIIGWLGSGPPNYGLPFADPRHAPGPEWRNGLRRSTLGELVFLFGHWD